jgi:hypothetical protein
LVFKTTGRSGHWRKGIEEFDPETLNILRDALDEAWLRAKANHLNGSADGARTALAQHTFAMAKQGERDPNVSSPVR